jgi:hypothetical protein
VRTKSKAELADIPDGSYEIFVTQGSDWDSGVAKFTRSASYSKFEKITDFVTRTVEQGGLPTQQSSIWTFTLHPVPLGNARTKVMSESEFDRY